MGNENSFMGRGYNNEQRWGNEQRWNNDQCWNNEQQRHVHEISGITKIVGERGECHNHRFATVSGEAMRMGNSHVHEVKFCTDFADGHFHEFCGKSSPAIEVGSGKHVHFADAFTDERDGHCHRFQVAAMIESPTDCE